MPIQIITKPIKKDELKQIAKEEFGNIVKVVIDIEQEIMAIGGELHADEEVLLIENENSNREHTWGINLYIEKTGDEFIEFDSMVNLKPALGNNSRGVENTEIREKIANIVKKLILE